MITVTCGTLDRGTRLPAGQGRGPGCAGVLRCADWYREPFDRMAALPFRGKTPTCLEPCPIPAADRNATAMRRGPSR